MPLIDGLLEAMLDQRGSDLILTAGACPLLRVDGELQPLVEDVLLPSQTVQLAQELLTPEHWQALHARRELDFSCGREPFGRFRVNVFFQRGCIGLALRAIPHDIPAMERLGLPAAVQRMADLPRGLVLVTGPTGSGKSTTLAAMLNHINKTRSRHIVTIEDPIEYLYRHERSVVEQREVGSDTHSFSNALRSALREDVDVVLVGEMRDFETMNAAITMAETGHLVLSTLHTNDAPQALDRMIDVFPPVQQQQVRLQLASSLQAIVAQLLLPRVGGGRVAAFEVLIATPAVRTQIREGAIHQLRNTMATGLKDGMTVMERSLMELYSRGLIREEEMLHASVHQGELQSFWGHTGGVRG